ncbi:hypothetical protein [Streptomyces pratensis]
MSETPPNTLQHRFDGPEDAPVLVIGPSLRALIVKAIASLG